jgi:hypothetical protein
MLIKQNQWFLLDCATTATSPSIKLQGERATTSHFDNVSQPHFGLSVRMKLTLPKVGTWSPSGLSKTQSLIVGVKTLRIEVFLVSLESS